MGHAPENTMASFELALSMGADAIELDVHMTADDELVVIHDAKLERTTSGAGLVRDQTLAHIRQLDAGAWFAPSFAGQRVPTLGETLEWARGRLPIDIEIKWGPRPYPNIAGRVVELVRQLDMADQVIVISFDHRLSKRVKQLAPEIATGVLYGCYPADVAGLARAAEADAVLPNVNSVDRDHIQAAHDAGLSIHPWTTSDETDIATLIEWGVDSICSNHPERVVAALERLGMRLGMR
jgi:glycerophosphoryl diester phosphodiesterase